MNMHFPRDYRQRNGLLLALITVAAVVMYGRQREASESTGTAMNEGSAAATKPRQEDTTYGDF